MKTAARNAWLGLTALVSLLLYILACASFSPDDTKVLFPAFDPDSGHTGIAVYDRSTKVTEMLLVVGGEVEASSPSGGPNGPFIRTQFIDNGRQVLAAWLSPHDDDILQIVTIGFGSSRRPVKTYSFELGDDTGMQLLYPLAVSGKKLFFSKSKTNYVELNLETGASRTGSHPAEDFVLFFAGERGEVFYALNREDMDWGRLNTATLELEPRGSIKNTDQMVAFDLARGLFLLGEEQDGKQILRVTRSGRAEERLAIEIEDLDGLGPGILSRDGRILVAGYLATEPAGKSIGLIEIPLSSGTTIRRTPLAKVKSGVDAPLLLAGVSHDGNTAALVSTMVADELVNPEDAGLFLVDLQDSKRKVTRVSMPPKPDKAQ